MALTPGTHLGPYEVVAHIGSGGMGEVYRATDRDLKRVVAIKVLPESVAADAERLARFQREAEVLASLNHPNIATIHGLERSGGTTALVMELVEGRTLADRIAQGPIRLDEALPIAKQIAEALEAAHEQGIIHRDLKPANIKIRSDGTAKVLDFGLAKAMEPPASSPVVSQSPTITSPAMTQAGMILGTAAYMSPEQARGKAVDKRADIWAFGCVFYEMLTSRRPFDGETVSDVLASVMAREPQWERLAALPPRVGDLIRCCLEKAPKARLRDIGDARHEIERCLDGRDAAAVPSSPRRRRSRTLPLAVAGLAMAGGAAWLWRPQLAPSARLVQVDTRVSGEASLVTDFSPAAVLSPDGSLLAFIARSAGGVRQLFIRRLDRLEATVLPGTEDARTPFFSPDGQWVGFFASGKLKKVPVAGGTVVTLCAAANGRGASWSEAGWIAFTPNSSGSTALRRVSDAGGPPEPLTVLGEGEATHRWPQVLPGAKGVLYTTSKNLGNYNDGDIVVQPLPAGKPRTLVRAGYFGRYLSSGHLTYVHDGRLFAVAFDLEGLALIGTPAPVLESVSRSVSTGSAQFAASDSGTAVYLPGGADTAKPLQWLRRDGTTTVFRASAVDWSNPRLSSNGERLAVDIFDGQQTDVWLYDHDRDTPTQLTFDQSEDWRPLWTPDGTRVVFRATRDSFAFNLFWQRADGGGTAERLTRSRNPQVASSWHPSGNVLAFVETSPTTNWDIMLLPLNSEGSSGSPATPTPFLNTPAQGISPAFSPDGRWIAYESNELGRSGVYVRPYPGPGGQWLIAPEGSNPTWSRARRELVFLGPDQRLMVSSYSVEAESFRAGAPRPWSSARAVSRPRGLGGFDGRAFDLHPDGERAIGAWVAESETVASQNSVVLAFNFFDELRRVAPVKR